MAIEDDGVLLCGVSLQSLIDQIADRRQPADPAHQSICPHCQAALRALRQSWSQLEAFARLPVRIPPDLLERIVRRIRMLAARGGDGAIVHDQLGVSEISERVIGEIARRAARSVAGVVLASPLALAIDPADRRQASLRLRLVVSYGIPLEALAEAVRKRVIAEVARQTGVRLAEIEVVIADLLEGPPA